jgi:hypothetical protein
MNVFDIDNSIIKGFNHLQYDRGFQVDRPGYMVERYVSGNLPCGTADLGNMRTMLNGANSQINSSLQEIGSVVSIIDAGVNSAFAIAEVAAGMMDKIAALSDKISELGIGDKLANLDFSLPDLNLNLSPPDAEDIRNRFNDIGDGPNKMMDSALESMSSFSLSDTTNNALDGFDVPLMESPIETITNMMKCQSDGILGMLAAGLSNLGASSSGFGVTDSLGGALGIINAAAGGVKSALSTLNTVESTLADGIHSIGNGANNLVGGAIGYLNQAMGGMNPMVSGLLQMAGVPGLMNTALNDSLRNALEQKSYSACQAAQSLNRFGNYDPFISNVNTLTGLFGANAALSKLSAGNSSSKSNACMCCDLQKAKWKQSDSYANIGRNMYDIGTSYGNGANIPGDQWSRTIAAYGFDDSNVLSGTLGTNLESYRLARKLKGNMAELQVDFSKYDSFESEAMGELAYVHQLNEDMAAQNLAQREGLLETAITLNT